MFYVNISLVKCTIRGCCYSWVWVNT